MSIQKLRRALAAISLISIIVIAVTYVDFSDLSWQTNRAEYLIILALASTFFAMVASYRYDAKK